MYFQRIRLICTVVLSLFSVSAWADSAEVHASYKCDKSEFSLYASVDSSGGTILAPPKMRSLKIGRNQLICQIGQSTVKATVDLSGPGHNGICGDPGTIQISMLEIDGEKQIEPGEMMLFYCDSDPSMTNLDIKKVKKSLVLHLCKGNWNWGNSFENLKCVDKIIAKKTVGGNRQ